MWYSVSIPWNILYLKHLSFLILISNYPEPCSLFHLLGAGSPPHRNSGTHPELFSLSHPLGAGSPPHRNRGTHPGPCSLSHLLWAGSLLNRNSGTHPEPCSLFHLLWAGSPQHSTYPELCSLSHPLWAGSPPHKNSGTNHSYCGSSGCRFHQHRTHWNLQDGNGNLWWNADCCLRCSKNNSHFTISQLRYFEATSTFKHVFWEWFTVKCFKI